MQERGALLRKTAQAGGEAMKSILPTEGIIMKEGRGNFVTAADLASEKAIMALIREAYPDDAILSEETVSTFPNLQTLPHLWVIDPIDGTNNFKNDRGYSAVSIGYVENGIIQAGAIYNPFREELFYTEKGQGAYLNDQRIYVSTSDDLAHAVVATDNSYDEAGTRYNLELALRLSPMPWILMKGSAVLMMAEIASGRTDVFFHTALKPWDNAAGFLLIEEAGGIVRGMNNETIDFTSPSAIMGNETLVKKVVSAFTNA